MRATCGVTLFCLAFYVSSLSAQQAAFVKQSQDSVIEKALLRPMTFDFKETKLNEVVAFIKDFAGVNILLDQNGLDIAGVDADEPVTLSLDNVPLSTALKRILDPLELTTLVREDVLLITDTQETAAQLVTHVYPALDLVSVMLKDGQKLFVADEMMDVIQATIMPDEWVQNGGTSDVKWEPIRGTLVVTAPVRLHAMLSEFVSDLRETSETSKLILEKANLGDMNEITAEAVKDAIARRESKKLAEFHLRKAKAEAEEAEERAKRARIEREKAEIELEKLQGEKR